MTLPGTNLVPSPKKPTLRRRNQRRVLAAILGLSGVAMVLVAMSDPRVSLQVRNGVDTVAAPFTGKKVSFADYQKAEFMGELSPSLPQSVGRVRVRRANILAED